MVWSVSSVASPLLLYSSTCFSHFNVTQNWEPFAQYYQTDRPTKIKLKTSATAVQWAITCTNTLTIHTNTCPFAGRQTDEEKNNTNRQTRNELGKYTVMRKYTEWNASSQISIEAKPEPCNNVGSTSTSTSTECVFVEPTTVTAPVAYICLYRERE